MSIEGTGVPVQIIDKALACGLDTNRLCFYRYLYLVGKINNGDGPLVNMDQIDIPEILGNQEARLINLGLDTNRLEYMRFLVERCYVVDYPSKQCSPYLKQLSLF